MDLEFMTELCLNETIFPDIIYLIPFEDPEKFPIVFTSHNFWLPKRIHMHLWFSRLEKFFYISQFVEPNDDCNFSLRFIQNQIFIRFSIRMIFPMHIREYIRANETFSLIEANYYNTDGIYLLHICRQTFPFWRSCMRYLSSLLSLFMANNL